MWKRRFRLLSLNDPGWGRGGGSDDKNAGGDGRSRSQRPGNDGPPDLDELWRDLNRKLNGLFGRRPSGGDNGGGGGGNGRSAKGTGVGLLLIALVALLVWLGSGFYIVQEGQTAAVFRFGELEVRHRPRRLQVAPALSDRGP